MTYNEKNVHLLLKEFFNQKPSKYNYEKIGNDWFDITIDWLNKNNVKSLTKDKVYIDTKNNIQREAPFFYHKLSGMALVAFSSGDKFFPNALAWFVDMFEKSDFKYIDKSSLFIKLLMKNKEAYEFCNNPIVIIFHELGHWVTYDYFCNKFTQMGKDAQTVELYSNQYLWRTFGQNKLIDDNSIENSAEWFVMYSLNPTFTKNVNPKVFKFFNKKLCIEPFLNVSHETIKDWIRK